MRLIAPDKASKIILLGMTLPYLFLMICLVGHFYHQHAHSTDLALYSEHTHEHEHEHEHQHPFSTIENCCSSQWGNIFQLIINKGFSLTWVLLVLPLILLMAPVRGKTLLHFESFFSPPPQQDTLVSQKILFII